MEIAGCDINNLEIVEEENIIFKDNDIIICKPKRIYKEFIKIMHRSTMMATCRLFTQYDNEENIFLLDEFYTKIKKDENNNDYIIHTKTSERQLRKDFATFNFVEDK